MRFGLGAVLIGLAVVAVYARTAGYGLVADDFGWLVGAQVFHAGALFDLSHRSHFFRPVMELYFPAALAVCGRSTDCYHWLSILLHAGTSLAVAAFAGAVSRTWAIGVMTGVLFAVMPGPTEAVVWVSAVAEVVSAGLFVLTVWSFHRAVVSGQRWSYAMAVCSFVACLLTHESGVTLFPLLVLSFWLLPSAAPLRRTSAQVMLFAPFALGLAAYLVVAYLVNSRNYVVTEGQYGIGAHMIRNVLEALATLAVTRRETAGFIVLAALSVWAISAAPPRVRFFTLWTLVTLIPVAGFRSGLSSRYLYLPALGFAGLTAEVLWWAGQWLRRWPRVGVAVWWVITIALTIRFAAFAVKNARVGEQASAPFSQYAARVRQLYPAPGRGARLEVPPPPELVSPQYVQSLLQWEFDDVTLTAIVRDR